MQKTIIIHKTLNTREIAYLVQTASRFESSLRISIGAVNVNAKSIMGSISLGITEGQEAIVFADGADEAAALEELCRILSE